MDSITISIICSWNLNSSEWVEISAKPHEYCIVCETSTLKGGVTDLWSRMNTGLFLKPQLFWVSWNLCEAAWVLYCSWNLNSKRGVTDLWSRMNTELFLKPQLFWVSWNLCEAAWIPYCSWNLNITGFIFLCFYSLYRPFLRWLRYPYRSRHNPLRRSPNRRVLDRFSAKKPKLLSA